MLKPCSLKLVLYSPKKSMLKKKDYSCYQSSAGHWMLKILEVELQTNKQVNVKYMRLKSSLQNMLEGRQLWVLESVLKYTKVGIIDESKLIFFQRKTTTCFLYSATRNDCDKQCRALAASDPHINNPEKHCR